MSGEGKSTLVWQFKPGSNSAAKERKHADEMAAGDLPVPNIRGGGKMRGTSSNSGHQGVRVHKALLQQDPHSLRTRMRLCLKTDVAACDVSVELN